MHVSIFDLLGIRDDDGQVDGGNEEVPHRSGEKVELSQPP